MLSRPEHGWTYFCLGEQTYGLSYLTDIPLDWLDKAIAGLQTMSPFAVSGMCEPGVCVCTVELQSCKICGPQGETACLPVSMQRFCIQLLEDIQKDLDAWSAWLPEAGYSEKERLRRHGERAAQLCLRLEQLGKLIGQRKGDFL